MLKKFLMSSIAIILTLALLTACGGGNGGGNADNDGNGDNVGDTGENVTIRFSLWDQFPQNIIDEFNAVHPNIEIEIVHFPDSDYSQRVNQMVMGGTAPDVILAFEVDLPRFAEAGAILPLDDFLANSDEVDANDFIPAVDQLSEGLGGTYGLPWAYAAQILFYNKDLFDEAGVDYPTADWTWEDFEEAAVQLTIVEDGRTVQWGADALTFRGVWWSLAGQGGDDILNDGLLDLGDGLRDALEFQYRLTNELGVSPEPEAGDSVADLFASGQAAMARTGSWMTGQYRDLEFNWDIETLPRGVRGYSSLHTGFYTINAASEHPEEAWKFIEFMMSERGQTLNSEWGNNPSALQSIATQGAWQNAGEFGPTNWEAIERAGAQGAFGYTLLNASVTTNLVNQFNAVLLGITSIDDIFDRYLPDANQELENLE